jgi:hypothetical protein
VHLVGFYSLLSFTVGCEEYNIDITVLRVQSLQYSVNSTRWTV